MGPQKETTSIMSDGGLEMHGIDVERAVGRRSDNSAGSEQGAETPDSGTAPEDQPARSPKREAAEEIDEGGSRKKLKETDTESRTPGAAAGGREDEAAPKKDAEGDVVITDPGGVESPDAVAATKDKGETGAVAGSAANSETKE